MVSSRWTWWAQSILVGPVDFGAVPAGLDPTPAGQRLDPAEDRARPMAHILGVFSVVASWGGRDRRSGMSQELVRLLVHAHHRNRGVVRAGVDVQDVLHPGGKLSIRLRRDGPALLQMRTKRRFFNTRPMVE